MITKLNGEESWDIYKELICEPPLYHPLIVGLWKL
jgi:hypothetical protein